MCATAHRLGLLIAGCFVGLVLGCGQNPIKVPNELYDWQPKQGVFHMQFPGGWRYDGGNAHGDQWAEFSTRGCVITVKTDLISSLSGDMMGGNSPIQGGLSPEAQKMAEAMAPISIVHTNNAENIPPSYSKYSEGKYQVFQSGFGSSRRSEFVAQAGMTGTVHGYRATVLAMDRWLTIFCHCPEKDWQNFKPVYDRVLESITPGH